MKKIFLTILIALIAAGPLQAGAVAFKADAPRLANVFLHWTVDEGKARDLARWDLVILDMDVQTYDPEVFEIMRQINPDIKILAYVPMVEVIKSVNGFDPKSLRYKLVSNIPESWYLIGTGGNRLTFWPGNWTVNVTDECPLAGGQRWNEYLPNFIKNEMMPTGFWDGIFFDNGWQGVTYFVGGNIDLNRDGRAAGSADANRLWQEGVGKTLERTSSLIGSDRLVVLNDGPGYAEHTQGVMIENLDRYGWEAGMKEYRDSIYESRRPSANILNVNTQNTGRRDDYRRFRFGYASSLLFDGFYSFDFGDQDHGQTWWYDEYDAYLGAPKGAAQNLTGPGNEIGSGIWKREFENGLIIVNSTWQNQDVDLLGEYEKLHGTQDPGVNDGSIVSDVMVSPQDGIILIRPIERIVNETFSNGSFVRIFNRFGEVYRTGFFAYDARFRGGNNVILADINNDGLEEALVADVNQVYIYDAAGRLYKSFYPYTERYRGGINITAGDLDQDGDMEIVTGTENGGGPHIRIFNHDGVLINPGFFAYGKEFRGGVHVTIGDLNGDGWYEIIAGAGYGGGPHVRVFGLDGRLINPGFFAYNPGFRGGVYVAAGDVNGDGRDEIITGPGPGGGPHVRIFNKRGEDMDSGGFFAYDVRDNDGVQVAVSDIDNDGVDEIIAETTSVFTLSSIK